MLWFAPSRSIHNWIWKRLSIQLVLRWLIKGSALPKMIWRVGVPLWGPGGSTKKRDRKSSWFLGRHRKSENIDNWLSDTLWGLIRIYPWLLTLGKSMIYIYYTYIGIPATLMIIFPMFFVSNPRTKSYGSSCHATWGYEVDFKYSEAKCHETWIWSDFLNTGYGKGKKTWGLAHYLWGFSTIPGGWEWDFWTINSRWWFRIFLEFSTPKLGEDDRVWRIFFRWVETTSQKV